MTLLRPGKDGNGKVLGRAFLSDGRLRLEALSLRRADELRDRVEAACSPLVRYRRRKKTGADELWEQSDRDRPVRPEPAEQVPPEVAAQLVREYKERHYADWPDQPLPALGGLTPRKALRTRRGRERLDLLLREMENHEARLPEGERFDFSRLRSRLGLE